MSVPPGLRGIRGGAGECPFAARMSHLNCHVVANRNLTSWPWPAFSIFLSKAIRGSPASMGLADASRRIRIADIELAYRITGRGKPVILVHGLACGQRMWFHQRRKLSDRHTVITYDQRGHGPNDAPDDASWYSAGHLTRDLAGMVDALNFDKVAIVGFSMGGGPALALAAARPERITHLVLADVGSGADDAWRIQWLARRWVDFAQRTGWDE